MPRVSIFMSSYNHAQYLHEAIDSVLAQTYHDFELFIVDDASTDASWSIIQENKDSRIKALRNPANRNDKVMMNRVIGEMAVGKYIAVHHSDNAWEAQKLEEQVAFLDGRAEIGAVFTHAAIIDEHGEPLRDRANFYYSLFDQPNRTRHEWLRQFFYFGNSLCHPSVLIRKSCYDTCGLYRLGLQQIPDLDMWVRLCQHFEIHVLAEKLTRYRVPAHGRFTSAVTPASVARYHYELLQVLEEYRALSWEDLERVFPQVEVYDKNGACEVEYALARVALEADIAPEVRLFGLNLLFETLNNPTRAEQLERLYGFTSREFSALVAKQDIFGGGSVTVNDATVRFPLARLWWKFRTRRLVRLVQSSAYFDVEWYLAHYPDVASSGVNAAEHYLLHGGFEGRDPGPDFSSREYYARHPDAARRRVNPLVDSLRLKK